jgi:DNA polymerase-3 subunit gamma/tau
MGTVPNAVFERMMEAVDGNRSAEVMTVANQLLDAGNSPAQLARQCARYLRNALIARIAGLSPEGEAADGQGAELLQISPDEQRRAARTAALFSEEELTRFLQVMLRTFDELGYRQEQRFHFELGLLKLVHLRRLLPIEEALSQVGGSGAPRPASTATPRPAAAPRPTPAAQPAAAPARATFSPFEQDKSRRHPEAAAGAPIHVATVAPHRVTETRGATAISVAPTARPTLESVPKPASTPPPAASPEATLSLAAGASDPQQAVVDALAAARLSSAADALADAVWTMADGEARIQTELTKTMLPVVMNAEAEKIARAAARAAGIHKLTLLPGTATPAAQKKPRAARSGSVQAKAMEHPMVQQAQKLFHADIQTVIDLRDND